MAKTKSWSVKGIDGETRDLARDAAQAAGMTIGAWIDRAILKAKQGALPDLATKPLPPTVPAPEEITQPDPLPQEDSGPVAADPPETPAPSTPPPEPEPEPVPEPIAEPEPESQTGPEPAPENIHELVAEPADRPDSVPGPEGTDDYIDAAQPLPPAATRPSPVRYAVLGILLVILLGGGAWIFTKFSDTGEAPRRVVAETKSPAAAPDRKRAKAVPAIPDEVRTGIEMANAGDAKAQHDVGMLHLTGRYVKKDSAEAAKWFERAAVQGLANAQFNLGVLYQRGEGVAQNDRLAFFWYQSAAEQGVAKAQHNLATAYANGKGVPQNYTKAVEWFTKAANAGLGASQFMLASIHEEGLATGSPDIATARAWYEKAVAQGDAQASERLAILDARIAARGPAQSAAVTPIPAPAGAAPVGRAEIREIQSLLSRMNFDPGPADGQMGKRTADAIKLYQKFAGIEVDGVPTRALLEEIRLVAGSMSGGG